MTQGVSCPVLSAKTRAKFQARQFVLEEKVALGHVFHIHSFVCHRRVFK